MTYFPSKRKNRKRRKSGKTLMVKIRISTTVAPKNQVQPTCFSSQHSVQKINPFSPLKSQPPRKQ
jgi:hypothetical protein